MSSPIVQSFALGLLLALSVQTSRAQIYPDCDSSAVFLDSGTVVIEVTYNTGQGTSSSTTGLEYTKFYISGDTVIVIDPESTEFSGICPELDDYSTEALFEQITTKVVRVLVEDLDIPSSANCTQPSTTIVMIPTCVLRTGSGAATTFTNVNPCDQSMRTVEHCLINGVASAGIVSTSNCTSCSTGEATCSGGGGSGLQ